MSTSADQQGPEQDLSTWAIERLQSFAMDARGRQLEAVRIVAQGHAYHSDQPQEAHAAVGQAVAAGEPAHAQ